MFKKPPSKQTPPPPGMIKEEIGILTSIPYTAQRYLLHPVRKGPAE